MSGSSWLVHKQGGASQMALGAEMQPPAKVTYAHCITACVKCLLNRKRKQDKPNKTNKATTNHDL